MLDGVFDDEAFAAIQKFQSHLGLALEGLISGQQRNLFAVWADAMQTKE